MNVALISREYPPFFGGGIGTATHALAQSLLENGHRPVVITVSEDGHEHHDHEDNVEVVRLPFLADQDWSRPHRSISTPQAQAAFRTFWPGAVLAMQIAEALPRLCQHFEIQAIEVPDTGALGWFALNRRRTDPRYRLPPVVCTVHSPTVWIERLNRASRPSRAMLDLMAMERDCLRWADAVLCPSTPLARWTEGWAMLPAGSIRVERNALGPLETIARKTLATIGSGVIASEESSFLFLGRLEFRKGIDTLVQAWPLVSVQCPTARLDLVGADTEHPTSGKHIGQALIHGLAADVASRITAHGSLPPMEVHRRLATAGVVVIPSPDDNYPTTLIEAMAHGKVCVVAESGGMAELVHDGVHGLTFKPGDPVSLATAMARASALSVQERTAYGLQAAQRVLDFGANAAIAQARIALYESQIALDQANRRLISDPSRADTASDDIQIVGVCQGSYEAQRLIEALRNDATIAFAHGWSVEPSRHVYVYATPSIESLMRASQRLGAIAVRTSVLRDPRMAPFKGAAGWTLAMALCSAGYAGAVVPEAITPAAASVPSPNAIAASDSAELARIHASRGWRILQTIYRLLHRIRGGPRKIAQVPLPAPQPPPANSSLPNRAHRNSAHATPGSKPQPAGASS